MAVKIRLKRMGNRHRPFYRLAAVDSRKKRDGAVIEELGTYDPLGKKADEQVKLKLARCAYWLSVGATPSPTVATLLKQGGLKPVPGTRVEDQRALAPK